MKTAYGHVVVVHVPQPPALSALHEGERALCAPWGAARQATFAAGRIALRSALRDALDDAPDNRRHQAGFDLGVIDRFIGRDDRGAPLLPAGLCGSVTHKDTVAAAVAEVEGDGFVGIDLELDEPEAMGGRSRERIDKLAAQTLTPRELALLPDDDALRRRALYERFSLKEALYKALDPILRRYVGFVEVEVDVDDDGAARFGLAAVAGAEGWEATGAVLALDPATMSSSGVTTTGIILTAARVRRR